MTEFSGPGADVATLVASPGTTARRPRYAVGVVTYLLFAVMLGGTAPTPLYPLYAQRLSLSPTMMSVVFAVYAIGIVVCLVLLGGMSDRVGRRRTLAAALGVSAASSLVFILSPSLPGLLAGRSLSGVSVGLVTGAGTAYLGELHSSRPRAALIASVTNMLALGAGPLMSGLLAQYAPAPTAAPYAVLLALLLPGAALAALPETVTATTGRALPGRLRIPARLRRTFMAAAVAVFTGFAVLGLLAALTGDFLATGLHNTSRLMTGTVVFGGFAAAGAAQLLAIRLTPRTGAVTGLAAVPAGLTVLVTALPAHSLALFLASSVLSGAGTGLVFRSGLALTLAGTPAEQAGEVSSCYFLAAYLGLTLPVMGTAVLITHGTLLTAALTFSVLLTALAVPSALAVLATVPSRSGAAERAGGEDSMS
ncbi:MFS transporter [Streptomyces sp. NPDC001852]|uniref:MFS transporter n=2 Tax=unclassified Streptomyces TaxID=2593676 RepID=UPI0036B67610